MTVSNEVYRHDYAGNDSTVLFAIGFYFLVDAHIKAILYNLVTEVETELTLTTHYTLTGAGNVNGGELTMITAPTSDETLTILRNVDVKQEDNYVEGTSFPAEDHEEALDKLTMIVQQLKEEVERGLRLAKSQPGTWTLPTPIANYFLRYNATADAFEVINIADLSQYVVSAFVETLLDDTNAPSFLATLGLDADLRTLVLPANITISTFVKTLLDDTDESAFLTTLGLRQPNPLMLPHTAFCPGDDTVDFDKDFYKLQNRTSLNLEEHFAPVQLPHGVTINSLTLYGYRDDASAALQIALQRMDLVGSSVSMALLTADWTDGYNSMNIESISSAVVDNTQYGYIVKLSINPNDSVDDIKFTGAKIGWE